MTRSQNHKLRNIRINTCKYQAKKEYPIVNTNYLINGSISVGINQDNKYTRSVEAWMAEGNTPDPAFSQEALEQYDIYLIKSEASKYLRETENIYKIRQEEKEIDAVFSTPQEEYEEVMNKRQEMRKVISSD